ncbi:MAG: hypothetical protein GC129_00325 [Proteobacteria bacterium]|nr:hypothetical protein [Pseudomonadota bacterium]
MAATQPNLVRVGALKGPHGLRGQVKAKLGLDDPELVLRAGPLLTADGRSLKVLALQGAGQGLVALTLEGVATVGDAARLKGVAVFLDRAAWPEDEGEVYLDALVGRAVVGEDGTAYGVVEATVDLPAGPAVSVGGKLVPLAEDFVSVEAGRVVLTALGVQLLAL